MNQFLFEWDAEKERRISKSMGSAFVSPVAYLMIHTGLKSMMKRIV